MSKPFILDRYRSLSVNEREVTEQAILWLKKKYLTIEEITFLTVRSVDRNKKHINIKREGKIAVIWRHIDYTGTPFDLYLTEVFPCLKSNRFIFVRWAWTGRRPELCQHILAEKVEEIVATSSKSILTLATKFDTLRVAKVNLHIRN